MKKQRLSRREFLRWAGLASTSIIIAACNSNIQPENSPDDEALSDEVPANAPIPINLWFEASSHEPEYMQRIEELNEKFNIDFTYEHLSSETINQKFPATLMAGTGFPDIIEQAAENIVKFMKGEDKFIPYVDLRPALMASPYAGQILLNRFDRYTKEGKLYGVPHDVHPVVMLYNDAAWQQYGVDLSTVDTYDKFLSACQTVEQASNLQMPDGRPLNPIMDLVSGANLTARMMDKGIWWTDETGKPMINTPEMKVAAENWMLFRNYHRQHDHDNQVTLLKEGQVMAQFCADWLYGIHVQSNLEDKEWLVNSPMRMTRLPGIIADSPRVTSWGGTSGAVPKQTPNADLGIEILLYLYFDNTEQQLSQRFLATGILPPVMDAWEDEAFHKPVEYLGGQIAGDIFIEAARDLPKYYEQWTTRVVIEAWEEYFPRAWTSNITLDECITTAYEQAIAEIEKSI